MDYESVIFLWNIDCPVFTPSGRFLFSGEVVSESEWRKKKEK